MLARISKDMLPLNAGARAAAAGLPLAADERACHCARRHKRAGVHVQRRWCAILWHHSMGMTAQAIQLSHALSVAGRRIFVDSGANDGLWSLVAAFHSCKVIAVEPQRLCLQYIAAAAVHNKLEFDGLHNFLSSTSVTTDVRAPDCCRARHAGLPNEQVHASVHEFEDIHVRSTKRHTL